MTPFHSRLLGAVSSGNPASAAVGTSGAIGERCRLVTINSRALPLSMVDIKIPGAVTIT